MLFPAGRARFTKPMKVEVFAHWVSRARDFHRALDLVFSLRHDCLAVTAIQSGPVRYALQFSQKMIVRFAVFVDENPARVRRVLLARFQQVH